MRNILTTLVLLVVFINSSNAQLFTYYQTNNAPKVIKPGTLNDTLLNPFAGGLNTPQFSNIDWNGDGKQDLLVFDRESQRPIAFVYDVNKATFVHAPQFEGSFGNYFSGWALLRDYNFDGKPDLFTASSAFNKVTKFPYTNEERMQLFVNRTTPQGKTQFNQYSNLLFDTGMYVAAFNQQLWPSEITSVSKSIPAIDDMDGDGDDDILTNEGISPVFNYYENVKRNKQNVPFSNDTAIYIQRDKCWGFVSYNYNSHTFNLNFSRSLSSDCDYNFWGKRAAKHADQTMLMIDLNGDGIKDIIYGDYEYKSLIALINGRLQNSLRIDSIVVQDTLFLSTNNLRRNFMEYPASYYVDIDADGKKEFVVSTNKDLASKTVNNIWIFDANRVNSNLQFTERTGNDFLYKDMLDLGMRSAPVFVDIDADGDQDLVVATSGNLEQTGNNKDRLYWYRNDGTNGKPVFRLIDTNYADISGLSGQGFFSAHPTFGDLNGDGKLDILIGEANGNIAYLQNTSTSTTTSYSLVDRNAFGILNGTFATPQLVDLDKDGLLDIVCGQAKGYVQFYKNTGSLSTPIFSATPTIDTLGGISARELFPVLGFSNQQEPYGFSAPHVADLDRDGDYDMVLGTNSGRVLVYKNVYANKDSLAKLVDSNYVDYSKDDAKPYVKRFGRRTTVAVASLTNDTLPDLMVGNIAGGLVFLGSYVPVIDGINEVYTNNNAISLYPNPAQNEVHIKFNQAVNSNAQYAIFDVMGKKIMEGEFDKFQTNTSITTSLLSNGLYFVQLTTNTWQATQRLLINK